MALSSDKKFQLIETYNSFLIGVPPAYLGSKLDLNMIAPMVMGFDSRDSYLQSVGVEIVDYNSYKDLKFNSREKAMQHLRELNRAMDRMLREANKKRRAGVEGYKAREGKIQMDALDLLEMEIKN